MPLKKGQAQAVKRSSGVVFPHKWLEGYSQLLWDILHKHELPSAFRSAAMTILHLLSKGSNHLLEDAGSPLQIGSPAWFHLERIL